MLLFYADSKGVEAIGSKHKQTVVWWVAEVWAKSNNTSGNMARSKVRWTLGRVGAPVMKSTVISSTGARLTSLHSPAPSLDWASWWSEVLLLLLLLQPALHWLGSEQFGIPGKMMDSLGSWRTPLSGYWRWLKWAVYNGFILVIQIFNYYVLTKLIRKDKATLSDVIIT